VGRKFVLACYGVRKRAEECEFDKKKEEAGEVQGLIGILRKGKYKE